MNPNALPEVSGFKHHKDVQIRFSDVDVLGHVNNTVYMAYYDTGKAYFFSEIMGRPIDWEHVETVIANIDCAFVEPIYFGEQIAVATRCISIHDKSFKLQQVLYNKENCSIKSACETVMVSFDPAAGKAIEMPAIWREALTRSMQENS